MADFSTPKKLNRYQQIVERIFFWHYKDGDREVLFERKDMERAAQELGIELPIAKYPLSVQLHSRRVPQEGC